jgi:hypothetical protein
MMSQGPEGGTTGSTDERDEDTLELELTPDQVHGLSRAAARGVQATARPVESTPAATPPPSVSSKPRLHARDASGFRLWPLTVAAVVVVITATIAWWAAAQRPAEGNPSAPAVAKPAPAPVVPPPAVPAETQGPPVQVRNPFDTSEVFEFPAATTKTQAREAVAELLLQRARDRRSQGMGGNAGSRRPARGAADESPGSPQPSQRTPR